jgi:hypothetical protein
MFKVFNYNSNVNGSIILFTDSVQDFIDDHNILSVKVENSMGGSYCVISYVIEYKL